ncbi:MAG: hypothetical protein ISS28_08205 [Candidatus Cloacimonetes bacterium]|nr:hypothetical protein [Candidatus Cloacimonadota bacterium]MBL7087055.1 hypothetical protein [Candidatus Cloacimonadota bacterium]
MATEKSPKKVSLIEVLMVILIVGIIVIILFPIIGDKQKIRKINEEVFPTFILIQEANNEFFKNQGEYAFDISQLNLQEINNKKYFKFELTDSTVIATTTRKFGKPGAKIIYNFLLNSWSTGGTEGVIDIDWIQ